MLYVNDPTLSATSKLTLSSHASFSFSFCKLVSTVLSNCCVLRQWFFFSYMAGTLCHSFIQTMKRADTTKRCAIASREAFVRLENSKHPFLSSFHLSLSSISFSYLNIQVTVKLPWLWHRWCVWSSWVEWRHMQAYRLVQAGRRETAAKQCTLFSYWKCPRHK